MTVVELPSVPAVPVASASPVSGAEWAAEVRALAEQRNAVTLSKTGPRGKAAFDAAWSDGRLTRIDMYRLREEAGRDIDAWVDMRAH